MKRLFPAILALSLLATGCATTSTLSQPVHLGKPVVMSGARLDIAALRDARLVKEQFGVAPPEYPLVDLPFSFAMDLFVLTYTVPAAIIYGQ